MRHDDYGYIGYSPDYRSDRQTSGYPNPPPKNPNEEVYPILTASEAKRNMEVAVEQIVKTELQGIMKSIHMAIALNHSKVAISDKNISKDTVDRLKGLGYKVVSLGDARDGDYYEVSWGNPNSATLVPR